MTRAPLETSERARLEREIEGEVYFDAFSRGRYATDASIYQMMPLAVVVPKTFDDVAATLGVARDAGVPVLARGGGTSQAGQTVNEAIVIDMSRHLDALVEVDAENATAIVEPGLVLDELNERLAPLGLWYPVDVSTSSRATIGGMTANNSCGARSIRYGTSRDNVLAIDALLADGSRARFDQIDGQEVCSDQANGVGLLRQKLLALGVREADEIRARFPDMIRRVGGYNIDALVPNNAGHNLAHLLVGSEGTLALSERIHLKLAPMLTEKVLGVCHFPTFHDAMVAAQHLVKLGPTAVELVDRTMIHLARDIALFRPVVEEFVRGEPGALLLVEFAEPSKEENIYRLTALEDLMAELGFRWGDPSRREGGVVRAIESGFQRRIVEVRKQGLNIMMSMKSEGKPVSFVEDCAVRLEDLAAYTEQLTAIFRKYGTDGTWYAHASVGTLHVRPVLNLKLDMDVKAMRAIAEEAFELVRTYKGSHSGEHGDGIVRSEFHEAMFGARMVENFIEVKRIFDPDYLLNPGKIVHAPRMDDRRLLRYGHGYAADERETVFRWQGYAGAGRGLQGAVEMCNNNGACRKLKAGVMCPSYRVTRNERDVVRGRANVLRLAMTDQLGPGAFTSDSMAEAMALCVSCKACRRECPTGVDMAKMKIEVLAARAGEKEFSLRDRIVGYLPHYAPHAVRLAPLLNLRDRLPGLAKAGERLFGLSAQRSLPGWTTKPYRAGAAVMGEKHPQVLLFADTFSRYFEPDNLRAAETVLRRAGFRVGLATAIGERRALCCGRTFLSIGHGERAKGELRRTQRAIQRAIERGGWVVGLEPSCVMTFRDEAPALIDDWPADWGGRILTFEEFLALKHDAGELDLELQALPQNKALLHGHCHQKAFDVMGAVETVLGLVPELEVSTIQSGCCGMAGAFGYQAETYDVSREMAELDLLPAIRAASDDTLVIADGTSCRHQIADTTGRTARHVAQVLKAASDPDFDTYAD